MTHKTNQELLERFYLADSESEVALHLATCELCAKRYRTLEAELRSSSREAMVAADTMQPTFWSRQARSIMRRVESAAIQPDRASRVRWYALAAIVAIAVASGLFLDRAARPDPASEAATIAALPETTRAAATILETEVVANTDPWTSNELEQYSDLVAWESWVETDTGGTL